MYCTMDGVIQISSFMCTRVENWQNIGTQTYNVVNDCKLEIHEGTFDGVKLLLLRSLQINMVIDRKFT